MDEEENHDDGVLGKRAQIESDDDADSLFAEEDEEPKVEDDVKKKLKIEEEKETKRLEEEKIQQEKIKKEMDVQTKKKMEQKMADCIQRAEEEETKN